MTTTFNSANYWENRYKENGNSGSGSYNNLAQFKADIINTFIIKHNIKSIIDYGVGDGNQLKLIDTENKQYIGIDVSPTIIKKCKEIFIKDTTKTFLLENEVNNQTAELLISCDVIYHLIEDDVYNAYMNKLFNMSRKFVIIYAKNNNINHASHVKFRNFTDYVVNNFKQWKLIKHIPNKYPQTILGKNNENTSPSDFYIFEDFSIQIQICKKWEKYIESLLLPSINIKLEGSLYSKHNSNILYPALEPKRYNIISLIQTQKPKNILEIGFNAGFSSLLMKMTNKDIELTCIDINEHKYVVPCFNIINTEYKNMNIILKPSQFALNQLIEENKTYDIIHIDGDHSLNGATRDLELCLKLSHNNTIIIFDDTNIEYLNNLCNVFIKNGKLKDYNLSNFIQCKEYKHRFFKVIT
jgi:predicted O-methyltransferase YrrM/SAM-dependent methyltransferase